MKQLRIKKDPKIIYLPDFNNHYDSSLDYWFVFAGAVLGAWIFFIVLVFSGVMSK